jgi:hypothetical protein
MIQVRNLGDLVGKRERERSRDERNRWLEERHAVS